ncbi:MAG: hypothetical protein WBC91_10210 [Phototrophicaceae bacterium]
MEMNRLTYLAIVGKIIDAKTQRPLYQARVEIISGPELFDVMRAAKLRQRVGTPSKKRLIGFDLALSRDDGTFLFTNLPEGTYELRCSVKRPTYYVPDTRTDVVVSLANEPLPPMTNFELHLR